MSNLTPEQQSILETVKNSVTETAKGIDFSQANFNSYAEKWVADNKENVKEQLEGRLNCEVSDVRFDAEHNSLVAMIESKPVDFKLELTEECGFTCQP